MDVWLVALLGLGCIGSGVIYFAKQKSLLWLGAFFVGSVLALTVIISVFFRELSWLENTGLGLALPMSIIMCRRFPNWAYFLIIPASIKLIDMLWLNTYLLTQVPSWVFYFTYIGYDLLVMTLIWYRGPIANILKLNVYYKRFGQEYLLLIVYGLFVLVNLITGIEELIYYGLIGDFFIDDKPSFFYESYRYMRLPLCIAEISILVMISYFAVKAGINQKYKIKGVRL
ncbi:hypothetical protein [uncultured Shewanella sp.]|uniref:hypothetical protein n=1 Tax=uncultured Shewanella sp. TaxID=173975 RepID=UPI0026246A49|nr:hypothetical protein [uncultured Shewanella sp.]